MQSFLLFIFNLLIVSVILLALLVVVVKLVKCLYRMLFK